MSASINSRRLQSAVFIWRFGGVTLCSADDAFDIGASRLHSLQHARRFRMGLLVEGKWQDRPANVDSSGRFIRTETQWRDWITRDGAPAKGRTRGFKAEPGRYHLYVSLACPW